jgi:hypothetical protein
MTMETILLIAGVALCCGLFAYGIDQAARRAKKRRVHDAES